MASIEINPASFESFDASLFSFREPSKSACVVSAGGVGAHVVLSPLTPPRRPQRRVRVSPLRRQACDHQDALRQSAVRDLHRVRVHLSSTTVVVHSHARACRARYKGAGAQASDSDKKSIELNIDEAQTALLTFLNAVDTAVRQYLSSSSSTFFGEGGLGLKQKPLEMKQKEIESGTLKLSFLRQNDPKCVAAPVTTVTLN